MYRAGPTPGGLPLPRFALAAFTAVVIAVSVLAVFIPWLLLLGKGPAEGWRTFREGGGGMWLIALLDFALPVALGIAGAVVVRGKRVPSGLFFGVAVMPFFAAIFFGWLAVRLVDGALSGGAVDPSQALRINAAGISEALSLDLFGGFVTCGAALIGAVALTGAVASIDVTTATRNEAQRPSSVFGAATLVAGAAWLVAILIVTALRLRTFGPISIWVVFVVGTVVPLAVFAARAAPVLRGWHDPIEARRAAGGLFVAGLAAMLAVVVFERAILARTASDVFGAVSGANIDPSQRAAILMELVEARKWTAIAYAIHGVLGGATFALAVAGSIGRDASGRVRHPISPSLVMAASVGVFVLAAAFALGVARTRSTERIASQTATPAPKGITLPVIVSSIDERKTGSAGRIVISANGTNTGEASSYYTCSGGASLSVLADRMATLTMVVRSIPQAPCAVELVFAGSVERDRTLDARLGDLAPFARVDIATFGLHYDTRMPTHPSSGYLTVRAVDDDSIEFEGHIVKLPLGPGSPDLRSSHYELVRYVLRPNDTVGHLTRIVMAVKQRFRSQLGWGVTSRLEIEFPPPPADLRPKLRLKTPLVNGRLTPEEISGVVLAKLPSLQQCYEADLTQYPKLVGTVAVKLVINREGTVSSAQPQAMLRDREFGTCLAKVFKQMTFPKPEGGIVLVTYPMEVGR